MATALIVRTTVLILGQLKQPNQGRCDLARLVKRNPPSGPDWVHEIHDGYRLIARRECKAVQLFTRRGPLSGDCRDCGQSGLFRGCLYLTIVLHELAWRVPWFAAFERIVSRAAAPSATTSPNVSTCHAGG